VLVAALATLPFMYHPAPAQEPAGAGRMRAVMLVAATEVIEPGYARFLEAARRSSVATDELCTAPGRRKLDAARAAFSATALAWARVENIRFGPVMSGNRLERVLFWPDRKSIGLRQVQALLATKDRTATDAGTLVGKSVAVQGLGALEFVLFGTGSTALADQDGFRCDYASAIARNLVAIAGELTRAWRDPNSALSAWLPGEGPGRETEMLNELVGALVHGLESIRDIRLRGFLGDTPGQDRPRVALFRRSGNTVPMIAAGIDGLRALFVDSGMESLLPDSNRSIGESIRFEFAQLLDLASLLDRPVAELLADEQARQRLVLLDLVMDSLIDRIDGQYAPAAGLAAGFSFSDGD
ncbi:MAG: imelysin family protein, partial [Pseudomonadota bacterium]|nr:imelysin family protein [Pseudomonadota bacterium]